MTTRRSPAQQWRAFAAWSDSVLAEQKPAAAPAAPARPHKIVMLDSLPSHARPRVGAVCPRCNGQVVRTHPRTEAVCLQCGHEPPQKRPAPYEFEPYTDQAATSRAAMTSWDEQNGPVTVKVAQPPLPSNQCVGCGATVDEERLKVHRCQDCYRQYVADLRMRAV